MWRQGGGGSGKGRGLQSQVQQVQRPCGQRFAHRDRKWGNMKARELRLSLDSVSAATGDGHRGITVERKTGVFSPRQRRHENRICSQPGLILRAKCDSCVRCEAQRGSKTDQISHSVWPWLWNRFRASWDAQHIAFLFHFLDPSLGHTSGHTRGQPPSQSQCSTGICSCFLRGPESPRCTFGSQSARPRHVSSELVVTGPIPEQA